MSKTLEGKVRRVWFRCSINLLLKYTGRVLTAAGIIAAMTILVERLLALSVINSVIIWSFGGVVTALILLLWLFRQPSRMQVSLLLDERLRLHERFSTTLALADSKEPFANAACSEARKTARRVSLQGLFPIQPSKCWIYAISTWLIALMLILFMPQKDGEGAVLRSGCNCRELHVLCFVAGGDCWRRLKRHLRVFERSSSLWAPAWSWQRWP